MESKVKNFTIGTPWKLIVSMSIPLLLGNIFQASYNLADTVIVGRFAGPIALAGVGIASPVFNLMNALLIGISLGSSILISQLFGAKRREDMAKAVSTVLWFSLILSIVLIVCGQLLTRPLLILLQTPEETFSFAECYLRMILLGLVCNVYYNQLTGLLRGLGNTRAPLCFLIISCCVNVGLDLLFVCGFHMGVTGAALATIIAEGLSAILTAIYLKRYIPELHVKGAKGIDGDMLKLTIKFGLPMGLQQASISMGHILMQGIINPFGTALIAGYTAATKIDTFAVMPIISLSSAVSAFSAQNAGAGDYQRVKEGYRTGVLIVIIICAVLACVVAPFRHFWMSLFVSVNEYQQLAGQIIELGAGMLIVTPLFYWVLGLIHITLNTMSGAGDTAYSMKSMILMMVLRVIFAWLLLKGTSLGAFSIWLAFPISWGIALCLALLHYWKGKWKKKGIHK